MTSFRGWADAWGNSWGSVVTDPNAMQGSASFSFLAALQVNSGEMQGSASFSITAALQLVEPPRNWSAEVDLAKRKWYVKRKKQLHIFDTAEEADSFIRAADEADKAIEKAKSKSAKKRVLRKVYEVVKPAEIIDVDHVAHLVSLYGLQFDIPSLLEQQDWEMFAHVAAMAQEIEEDEIEMLLLA